jgi:hypothetical protein
MRCQIYMSAVASLWPSFDAKVRKKELTRSENDMEFVEDQETHKNKELHFWGIQDCWQSLSLIV